LHASIYDAINGITRSHESYFVRSDVPASASIEAAASGAAHAVLVALFPAEATRFDDLHAAITATISIGPHKMERTRLGSACGARHSGLARERRCRRCR
jgi:hypothetical protein